MELKEIESLIESPDPQYRIKAIAELRHYQPSVAVPLLKRRIYDKEFVVRSFAAMGLGFKRTNEGFDVLLNIIEYETDSGVIAEAANSLAKYGPEAISHLVKIFENTTHWLVRQSILAAIEGVDYPDVLLKLCRLGYEQDDLFLRHAALTYLEQLTETLKASEALDILLEAASAPIAETRATAARVLRHFDDPRAEASLLDLRSDSDYQVVGATLERLV